MDNDTEQSPFARPGFLIAAVLVAALVIAGIVVVILTGRQDTPTSADNEPTSSSGTASSSDASSASPTPSAAPVDAEMASTCGLVGDDTTVAPSVAPEAEWIYQGANGYPSSPEFGPGESSPDGVNFCFQHSPTGAVFMAANAVAQSNDESMAATWLRYVVAEGPSRDVILSYADGSDDPTTSVSRVSIAGFRVLAYDGSTARVDVASQVSAGGNFSTVSSIYELVWQNGDWRLSAQVSEPINVSAVPDLAGYISWGA